ncbi:hypothetical protein EJB05_19025 [Eragrostis curvula]|uniref:RRM domain-containing protein n=1 Tax=Eragrostis curvula TaxID=38414 RepID=A0A5J9VMP9_9POAL|nr:hypothetical protein EJB05_19025 [Eragrostis curvula]
MLSLNMARLSKVLPPRPVRFNLIPSLSCASDSSVCMTVKVVCHPTTGKSKGYGFVKFPSQEEAAAALNKMNGEVLDERSIRVQYANSG